jgi:hypothetical protein
MVVSFCAGKQKKLARIQECTAINAMFLNLAS